MHNIIGLTGATGAGKSTAAMTLRERGCYIIDADTVAREALAKGSDCLQTLAEYFGYDIIDQDGQCNRRLLAQRAFADAEKTALLNKTTHPWIKRRIEEYITIYRRTSEGYIVIDAPLLYESGCDSLCDKVIAVTAPAEIRLHRIMQRDGLTKEEALLRMQAQPDSAFYTGKADFIIDGSQPLPVVQAAVAELLENLESKEER